jgi:hypothetical protein
MSKNAILQQKKQTRVSRRRRPVNVAIAEAGYPADLHASVWHPAF